jgi:lipid-A-disaccharide synthase
MLITIDSPGFTYRVAKSIREAMPKLKIIHIVAPSVWVYKSDRALEYAKIYNHLLALLPFEPQYFIKVGLACSYIGHPILEQKFSLSKAILRKKCNIETRIICVTLGSRNSEIKRHAPIFCQALQIVAKTYQNIEVIFVLADQNHEHLIKDFLYDVTFNFQFSSDRLASFAIADIALAKSGTNTLEIAASRTPMIVAYKLNIISYFIIKCLIKVKYVSLLNIIAKKELIPELLQFECSAKNIATSLIDLLTNPDKAIVQVEESQKLLQELGLNSKQKPSIVAASIISNILYDANE